MSKLPSTLRLNLPAPPKDTPLYRWLYDSLRQAILTGTLHPGARLPSTRDLAQQYELSRPTVTAAFDQLRAEGYVEGRVGSGTYVSQTLPEQFLQTAHTDKDATQPRRRRIHLSHYARRLPLKEEAGLPTTPGAPFLARSLREKWANGNPTLPRTTTNSPARAFRANQPALDQFPTDLWAQVATRRLRRVSTNLLAGGDPLGYRPLRQSVADYLNTSRGVKCTADQVLITSGVQEALDRVAHLLLNPDDPVWIENPGYPGAANAFHAVGARLCRVRVDAEGLDLRDGQRRHPRPRLVYVTPAHQFPLGITMSLRRRLELLEWARRQGVVIFEDDYDSEYRYSGRPVPGMQGLDRANMVIFAGSFSDVLFPALRLGYVVVPPDMIDIFAAAESVTTHHPPLIDQAILTDFIDAGHFARHVRRMRNLYAERLGVLLEEGRSKLAGFLEFPEVEAGLRTVVYVAKDAHVAAGVSPTGGPDRVAAGVSPANRRASAEGVSLGRGLAEQIAQLAARHNVELVPLSRYASGHFPHEGLMLGFAAVGVEEIRRGVAALEKLFSRDIGTRTSA